LFQVKIADFGLSIFGSDATMDEDKHVGALRWTAPEVRDATDHFAAQFSSRDSEERPVLLANPQRGRAALGQVNQAPLAVIAMPLTGG
jgi:hypothetical protein